MLSVDRPHRRRRARPTEAVILQRPDRPLVAEPKHDKACNSATRPGGRAASGLEVCQLPPFSRYSICPLRIEATPRPARIAGTRPARAPSLWPARRTTWRPPRRPRTGRPSQRPSPQQGPERPRHRRFTEPHQPQETRHHQPQGHPRTGQVPLGSTRRWGGRCHGRHGDPFPKKCAGHSLSTPSLPPGWVAARGERPPPRPPAGDPADPGSLPSAAPCLGHQRG